MRRFALVLWGIVMSGLVLAGSLQAQEVTARIRGTVTDASGAGVPGAEVRATNTLTGVSTTIPTADDGNFEFLQLPIGDYDVKITKPGFRTYAARHIVLVLNQVYNLQAPLEVGQVTESVQVVGNVAQVQTTTTQMETVIEGQKIVDMPLLNRNWTQLEQVVPGVVAGSDRFGTTGAYATNGSQGQQNSFLINGADAADIDLNTPLVIPSPDAIAEFNLIDSTINPEYGRNSGGILNAIIKSGTNAFHGDAFDFYRDTFLNTHNFFQKTQPVFHQNQFGGTLGGPIVKDHMFFFISYQGTRARSPDTNALSNTVTVFSADQRNGFFPDLATSAATSPFPLVGENGNTFPTGTPYKVIFPTGHIPTKDFNSISQTLLGKYIPTPNLGATQYSFNPTQTTTTDQGIARLDHTFGDHDALWFSLFEQTQPIVHAVSFIPQFSGGALPGGGGELDLSAIKQFAADWSHTFNPTTINELRASYLRFNYHAVEPLNTLLPSSLGFTGINPQFPNNSGVPLMQLTGYFALGFGTNGPQPRIDQNYQLADNFSKVIGRHTLKFGYSGTRYQYTNPFEASNSGSFVFGGAGTYTTGDPGADFFLGIPDSYSQASGGFLDSRTYEHYFFAQDSWKFNNDLTLNFGTGYQIDTPLDNFHFNGLDKNCFRPGQQSAVFPTAPKGLVFPGDTGCTTSGYYNHYDHIGPRFGFAYSPDWGLLSGGSSKKFVIRGGFGVYFNRTESELTLQDISAVPFSLSSSGIGDVGGDPSFAKPFTDIKTGQSVPNKFPFVAPTKGSNVDFTQFYPMSLYPIDPNFTSPYAMNFNLNIQREFPGAMILQMGYVGAQARHLVLATESNPISPAGAAACAADPNCIAKRVFQPALYPTHTEFAPGDIFASVGTEATRGVSSYNSLQVSLSKRLTHGLSFLLSYTYSHSIDIGSSYEDSSFNARAINPYNFALNRGDSAFDARHRFVATYDYELPHLSKYWNNAFTKYALDGWRVGGITTLQTGFPITVADTGFRSLTCSAFVAYDCWDAPNLDGPVATFDPRTSLVVNTTKNPANTKPLPYYYFNPNAFSLESFGMLGNAGWNNFHGPGINNTDLALAKKVQIDESRSVELRLEAFNAFNHTQFLFSSSVIAVSDINSSNFGRSLTARQGRIVQLGAKVYF
ncbi:MAG TPA: carboxypeptidase regulatory-like domain-containing protein [Bryobacteraceae bacterium]|nr:carboxypeptidase regulatory-like domain-containing protein [Bryobacteraceae bacterium]